MSKVIEVHGDIALIPLSLGMTAIIDSIDADLVKASVWYAKRGRNTNYAIRAVYIGNRRSTSEHLHRVLVDAPPGMQVDHIDGNGLNNRRSNLRLVSASENAMNQRLRKNNTSGHRGIHFDRSRNKWVAQIQAYNKPHYIGRYESMEEAIAAYLEASSKLHSGFGEADKIWRIKTLQNGALSPKI